MTSMPVSNSDPWQQLHLELDAARKARDQAQIHAVKWRQRYELEAQQRRQDAEITQKTIHALRLEVQQLCQLRPQDQSFPALTPAAKGGVKDRLLSLEELRTQLATVTAERDQLTQALTAEKENHANTRANLINALNDAMRSQPQLPSSPLGARAGSVISKDREQHAARRRS